MFEAMKSDETWGKLAEGTESEREPQMRPRYMELAGLPEAERVSRLEAMVNSEYALPDEKLRPFTKSRLRTWLGLDADSAKVVIRSYDAVMDKMPGGMAMRQVNTVQTVARQFSHEEQVRLHLLVPAVFVSRATEIATGRSATGAETPRSGGKKAWWAFWK